MRWKTFLIGLLIVLAAPLLVLAAFAAWVHFANSAPQTGPLTTAVHPQMVWPWQDAAYLFTVRGNSAAEPAPPEAIDLVFLIDISGSMTSSLPAMAEAADLLARDLAAAGDMRFALVGFDIEAEIEASWTADPGELVRAFERLGPFKIHNDTRAAFVSLRELLADARPAARKVAVWYTDGDLVACPADVCSPVMSGSEILTAGEELARDSGLEHLAVGLPGDDAHPLLIQLTGSPERVFEPADARDLVGAFRSAAEMVLPGLGDKGRLSVQLDGRHFATPLEGTGWQQVTGGTLLLDASIRPDRALTYGLPLDPRSLGLWRVGLRPASLTYVAEESSMLVEADAGRRPALLVVTWLAIFLAFLPALVWAMAHWPRGRHQAEKPEILQLPSLSQPPLPSRLPALPSVFEVSDHTVPTLFIGLGGAGRRALEAVRGQLKEAHLGSAEAPYQFLCLDVEADESAFESAFDDWPGYPIKRLAAPPEIARVASYLPEPGSVPERWAWFDAERYHDAPRENLNLTHGTRGDRSMARLALFRWLETGDLAGELQRAGKKLAAFASSDGCRQVVVMASRDGGFGGGVLLDLGRLIQRLGRDLQAGDPLVLPPEVLGIVCDDAERPRPENRDALELEVRTAMLTGAYPTRTCYAEDDPLLDRVDSETPFHRLLSVTGFDATSIAAQCAEIAVTLTERRPRRAVLESAADLDDVDEAWSQDVASQVIATRTASLHVVPTLIREQVGLELLLRLLGPDVLLDVEPAPGGGFVPVALPDDEAARRLADWAAEEPVDTPLAQLLEGAQNPAALPALAATLERADDRIFDWLPAALKAAINRRLQGYRDGSAWHRAWHPAAAAATLRLLGRRLEDARPDFERTGAGDRPRRAWTAAAEIATAAAEALADEVEAFCRLVEPLAARQRQLADRVARLQALDGYTLVDVEERQKAIERWSYQVLERWLGSCDTVSLLRERLFLGLVDEAPGLRVVLHSHVGAAETYETAEAGTEALVELTRALSAGLPATRLAGALAKRDPDRRRDLATTLVNRDSRPHRVVLVTPRPAAGTDGSAREKVVLQELRHQVPQPADHGRRTEALSGDLSTVRRIELERRIVSPMSSANCVAMPEREAERLRRRIARTYRLDVPPLPPALRLALTRPQAFRSFARAYRAGRIVRRRDDAGKRQWYFLDRNSFLTHGDHRGLASAAIGYVGSVDDPVDDFPDRPSEGDFEALAKWRRKPGEPTDDVLVQAAIDCAT